MGCLGFTVGGNPLKLSHFRTTVVENSLKYSFPHSRCALWMKTLQKVSFWWPESWTNEWHLVDTVDENPWKRSHFEKIAPQWMNIAVKYLTLDRRNKWKQVKCSAYRFDRFLSFASNSSQNSIFSSLKLLWETHILSPSSQFLAFSLQSTEFAYLGTPCHDPVSKLPLPGHWFWPDFVWFLPRFLGQLEFWAKEPLGFHWEWIEKHNFEQKNLWDFTGIAGKNRIHTWRLSFLTKFTFSKI